MPCYNDGESIRDTIESIYSSCKHLTIDVIVVDDKSTDNSLQVIHDLQKEYSFLLIENEHNIGKVQTLNNNMKHLQSDIFFVIDADVVINTNAIHDVLARFAADKKIG